MAHGKIRVNTLTYDTGSGDVDVAVSGLGPARTDSEINTLADARADARIAADLASGTPTIQAADADTAKTDVAQLFTAPQRGAVTVYTGTAFNINFATSNNFVLKPSGNYTVQLSGLGSTKGQTGSIFVQPSAAATISGSWPTAMRFVGGTAGITLTGTNVGIDRIDYIVLDDTSGSEIITCNVTANYVY